MYTLTAVDRLEIEDLATAWTFGEAVEIAVEYNTCGKTVAEFTRQERIEFAAANLKIRKG
jgi:hypothetical protein